MGKDKVSELSRKNRSTMFNREAEVGVKYMLKRGCFSTHSCMLECLWHCGIIAAHAGNTPLSGVPMAALCMCARLHVQSPNWPLSPDAIFTFFQA